MIVKTIELIESFSEADLEFIEFLPEELEQIESELYPDLENISFEDVAEDMESYFTGRFEEAGLEGVKKTKPKNKTPQRGTKFQRGSYGYYSYLRRTKGLYKKMEIDHFPPVSSYRGTKYAQQYNYNDLPAFPLETNLHRFIKGKGGFGGHASSTGKTMVSGPYVKELRDLMLAGNYASAMQKDMYDKLNLTRPNMSLVRKIGARMKPAVLLANKYGWIDSTKRDEMLSYLRNPKL
ncbi:MAG: hypothetical protein HC907_37435 [Richelia sp. SM1_7_0]|nr:hypothetical protein [Richelia sp. SM1_7_0]